MGATRTAVHATLLGVLCVSLQAQVRPVLSISFDEGFGGTGPAGPLAAEVEGRPELVPGRTGRALKSGPGTGYVHFPTAGLITPAGGTVELWVCALDWKAADNEFHVFFDTRGEGALYLYKFHQGTNLLMLTCSDANGPYTTSAFSLADWRPGEWHHLAGTWSPLGVMAYVDGKPAGKAPVEGGLPVALGERFRVGDHPWHLPRQSASLVDEVRIYDRPLSAAHIAAHVAGDEAFTVPLGADLVVLKTEVDPEARQATLRVSTGGADVEDTRLGARMAVVRQGAALPADAAVIRFGAGQARATVPMPSMDPGDYEAVVEVLQDGRRAFELRRPLRLPTTDWRGSRLGLEERVLPPWTPLEVDGSALRCWGREARFDQAALPVQITSGGEALLARPVSLTAAVAGQRLELASQGLRCLESAATQAEFAGELLGQAGGTAARVDVRIRAEYDGLLVVTLSGAEFAGLPLSQFVLEVPVKAERALYRHRWGTGWAGPAGSVPPGDGVVDQDTFIPYAWLGDNDRGLFWFCESDQYWPNGESPNAVEIVRSGSEVTLRLNLLAQKQKLVPEWAITFGLQATPVKPLPRDWRKWRLLPAKGATVGIMWPTPNPDSLRYYGYPEATTPELFAKSVGALHARNCRAVPYLCLSFLSAACPEWPFFGKTWAMGSADTGSSDVAAYGAAFAMVSPLGRHYSDFIVDRTARFAEQYGIDGLYHDNTHPYGSSAIEAGCGYLRDGRRRPTYPILGYRALYRRMYNVAKAWPRETFTMAHMSGKVTIPILAYEDSYLDGEHFRGRVKDCYLDLLPLDTFRAEFMGRQWGIMPFFLPEFDEEHAKRVEPTRGLMGLLMAHDVAVWAIWCNAAVVDEAYAALDQFGYADAEFLPYFAAVPPATCELPDVLVSGYRRADGQVLLAVANLARDPRSGTVVLNPRGMHMGAIAGVTSWPDRAARSVVDARLSLDLPGLSYRLLRVEPAP
jgi:hypothetical protein